MDKKNESKKRGSFLDVDETSRDKKMVYVRGMLKTIERLLFILMLLPLIPSIICLCNNDGTITLGIYAWKFSTFFNAALGVAMALMVVHLIRHRVEPKNPKGKSNMDNTITR